MVGPEQEPRPFLVDDDRLFARREARAERAGWLVMTAIVVAGALGFFGNGPLSHRTVHSDNGQMRYQRFARNQGRTTIEVEAQPAAARGGQVEVWVAQDFLGSYVVEEVRPDPAKTSTRDGGVVFSFALEGTGTALKAMLSLRPDQNGRHRGAVAIGGARPVMFAQFVYP